MFEISFFILKILIIVNVIEEQHTLRSFKDAVFLFCKEKALSAHKCTDKAAKVFYQSK